MPQNKRVTKAVLALMTPEQRADIEDEKKEKQRESKRKSAAKARARKREVVIGTLDLETDPFKEGRLPKAFAAGIYDGENYREWWGEECVWKLGYYLFHLNDGRKHIYYAHNGGRFDFHFIMDFISMNAHELGEDDVLKACEPFVINGRIVKITIGNCELRDSFAILPVGLATYQKTEIDYEKFEADVREKHKEEILSYLKDDCIFLHQLVTKFREKFDDALTIGSAALAQLTNFHPWDKLSPSDDKFVRPFYFGGRVQCFETGILPGNFKVYDINSQYPAAMKNFTHPIGNTYTIGSVLTKYTDFLEIDATSKGCLPIKDDCGLNIYPKGRMTFKVTGHELREALDLDLVKIHKINYSITFHERCSFADFVDTYYNLRLLAKKGGEAANTIFYKLILNSSYGKFGQNPDNWRETIIRFSPFDRSNWPSPTTFEADFDDTVHWRMDEIGTVGLDKDGNEVRYVLFSKPAEHASYNNVAVAASITGAARARIMRGISKSIRPIYCDTDSIVCESLSDDINPSVLGAFKHEADVDLAMIHGPKFYIMFKDGEPVKMASKGVKTSVEEMIGIFMGKDIQYKNMAPSYAFGRAPTFTHRTIKAGEGTLGPSDIDTLGLGGLCK